MIEIGFILMFILGAMFGAAMFAYGACLEVLEKLDKLLEPEKVPLDDTEFYTMMMDVIRERREETKDE